jgi:autotransporter-associated beta strand protein
MLRLYLRRLLKSLFAPARRSRSRSGQARRAPAVVPVLEVLETRLTPNTDIWTGKSMAATFVWSDAANWSNGKPNPGDDLVFPANVPPASLVNTDDLAAGTQFDALSFSGSGYTLQGSSTTQSITLGSPAGGGSINVSGGSQNNVIGFDIQMGGAAGNRQFFTVNFGADLTLAGHIKGSTGVELTKEGTGTLVLSNDNSAFTGPITLDTNAGVLQITNAKALGDTRNGTTVLTGAQLQVKDVTGSIAENLIVNGSGVANDGALLNLAGDNVWTGTVELDSNAALGASAGSLTISGLITDLGAGHNLTKVGPGQIIFAHANNYRGTTTIDNGILTIRDPLALSLGDNTAATGTVVKSSPSGSGTLQIEDPTGVGFTVSNKLLTLNGPGTGALGALDNRNGNNTWTGNVTLGSPAPNGSDVSIGVEDQGTTRTELTVSGVVQDRAAPDPAVNLAKVGPGRLIFTNSNTYLGTTTVVTGALNIRDSQGLGPATASGGTTVNDGAALELQTDSTPDSITGTTNTLSVSEALTLNGTGINGTGALRSVNGINVYTGPITLGTLAPIDAVGVEPDPNPHGDASYFTNDFSLTITGGISGGQNGTPTPTIFAKVGQGQLILPNANTNLNGPVQIEEGWITIQNNQSLGVPVAGVGATDQPAVTVLNGAALHLLPGGSLTIANRLVLSGHGITHPFATINQEGALLNLGGVNTVTGDVGLLGDAGIGVQNPPQGSRLTLSGSVSQTSSPVSLGATASGGSQENSNIIDTGATSGTLTITYDMFSIPDELRVYYGPRGTPGSTRIVDTGLVSGSGTVGVSFGPGTGTRVEIVMDEGGGISGTAWTYTGSFTTNAAPGGITKLGSGRLILQGAGTYTGATTVNDGTLLVNGSTAAGSAVAVNNGSTLGGSGTVNGTVTVNSGHLAPGDSPGILTTGALNFSSGSNLDVEIGGNTPGNYDQDHVTSGTVSLGSATLNLTSFGGYVPQASDEYVIINNDGGSAISGTFVAGTGINLTAGTALPEGSVLSTNFLGSGGTARITYAGGDGDDVAIVVDGPVSFTDNTGNGQLTLQRVKNGGTDNIQLLRGNTVIDSRPTAGVTSYTVTDNAGNDTLTVNYGASGGFFNVPVTFHGDAAAGVTDTLAVTGGNFARATHTFTTTAPQHSGNIVYDVTGNGTNTDTLNYDGLKPVLMNNGTINDIIFNLPAGTVQATLQDAGNASNNTWQIVSPNNAFETTTFTVPTSSLTINAGGGNDDLLIDFSAGAALPNGLSFDGGAGVNTLTLNEAGSSTADTVTVTATSVSSTVAGSVHYASIQQLTFDGGNAGNTFLVQGSAAGTPVTLNTGNGNDVVYVSSSVGNFGTLAGLLGALTVNAGGGSNTLVVSEAGRSSADTVLVTSSSLSSTVGSRFTINYTATGSFSLVNFATGTGGDRVNVQSTRAGTATGVINFGGPDVIDVCSNTATNQGDLSGVQGPLSVIAMAGSDLLVVSEAARSTADTVLVTSSSLTSTVGAGYTINVSAAGGTFSGVNFATGTGGDGVNVQSTQAGAVTTIYNFGGADVIDVCSNTATNQGDLSGLHGALSVVALAGTDLLVVSEAARTSADTVTVNDSSITSTVGAGFTINFSAAGGTFTGVNFATGTASDTVNVRVASSSGYDLTLYGVIPPGTLSGDTLSVTDSSGGAVIHSIWTGPGMGIFQVLYAGAGTKNSTINYQDFVFVFTNPVPS